MSRVCTKVGFEHARGNSLTSLTSAGLALVVALLPAQVAAQRDPGLSVETSSGTPDVGQSAPVSTVDTEPSTVQADADNELADLSLEELMEVQVVVTASRREQKITSVPYAISVITAEDIRAAGVRSVPDTPGAYPAVTSAMRG